MKFDPAKFDFTLLLLFAGLLIFTVVLIGVEHFFKDDGQIFQVISGLVTGFAGCFFGRMKPPGTDAQQRTSNGAAAAQLIPPEVTEK